MAHVDYNQPLRYRHAGVGQVTLPSACFVQVPVAGNAQHHLSMSYSRPFVDPSPMQKGYPHPNMTPRGMDWITTVRNATMPSETRKAFGQGGTGRWSAQAIRQWLIGQKLAKQQNLISYRPQG